MTDVKAALDALEILTNWAQAGVEVATRGKTIPIIQELSDDVRESLTQLQPKGKFNLGDRVKKISGGNWHGRIVGFYRASLTPIGYCVESERETGSVQIYPEKALELYEGENNDQ